MLTREFQIVSPLVAFGFDGDEDGGRAESHAADRDLPDSEVAHLLEVAFEARVLVLLDLVDVVALSYVSVAHWICVRDAPVRVCVCVLCVRVFVCVCLVTQKPGRASERR